MPQSSMYHGERRTREQLLFALESQPISEGINNYPPGKISDIGTWWPGHRSISLYSILHMTAAFLFRSYFNQAEKLCLQNSLILLNVRAFTFISEPGVSQRTTLSAPVFLIIYLNISHN